MQNSWMSAGEIQSIENSGLNFAVYYGICCSSCTCIERTLLLKLKHIVYMHSNFSPVSSVIRLSEVYLNVLLNCKTQNSRLFCIVLVYVWAHFASKPLHINVRRKLLISRNGKDEDIGEEVSWTRFDPCMWMSLAPSLYPNNSVTLWFCFLFAFS